MKIFPLEFSSFESLFKDKKLVIPYYQRDYIWNQKDWEKWLDDVEKLVACEDVEEVHFIGNIIYKRVSETSSSFPEYLIIDGQQRITTFFVFCLAILERFNKNNPQNHFLIESINRLLFRSDKNEPKLIMRGENENSLTAIIRHKNPESNEERVYKAYQYFKKSLGGIRAKNHLGNYFEKLKDGVKFIAIKLEKEDNALAVFKSINASGVILTSADLTKAELSIIYEEKGLNGEKLALEWEEMKKRVGKENISHFFYVFLQTKYGKGKYSKKDFFDYFQKKLSEKKAEIETLWEEVIRKSKIYSQILNPRLDYWGEVLYLPILEIKILADLELLYPLIIVLKEKELPKKKKVAILEKLIIYSFRKRTKGAKIQSSEALKWADLVENDQLESIPNDSKIIKETEKSNIFWDELEQKDLKEREIKWLLTKFYLTFLPEGFLPPLQLEHMFPKNPSKEWWNIPEWKELEEDEKQIKEKLYSLGNATLLTPK